MPNLVYEARYSLPRVYPPHVWLSSMFAVVTVGLSLPLPSRLFWHACSPIHSSLIEFLFASTIIKYKKYIYCLFPPSSGAPLIHYHPFRLRTDTFMHIYARLAPLGFPSLLRRLPDRQTNRIRLRHNYSRCDRRLYLNLHHPEYRLFLLQPRSKFRSLAPVLADRTAKKQDKTWHGRPIDPQVPVLSLRIEVVI